MPASPTCQVKIGSGSYAATTNGVTVSAADALTVKIADTSGVRTWSLTIIGTDEGATTAGGSTYTTPTITTNSVAKTATLTVPNPSGLGLTLILKSVVNGGLGADGQADSSLSTTFLLAVLPTGVTTRLIALNQTTEGGSAYGWIKEQNACIRAIGSGGPPSGAAGGGLGGTYPNPTVTAMTATVGGAVPTPPNNTSTFLRGDGTFAAPPAGGSTNYTGAFSTRAGLSPSNGDTFTPTDGGFEVVRIGGVWRPKINGIVNGYEPTAAASGWTSTGDGSSIVPALTDSFGGVKWTSAGAGSVHCGYSTRPFNPASDTQLVMHLSFPPNKNDDSSWGVGAAIVNSTNDKIYAMSAYRVSGIGHLFASFWTSTTSRSSFSDSSTRHIGMQNDVWVRIRLVGGVYLWSWALRFDDLDDYEIASGGAYAGSAAPTTANLTVSKVGIWAGPDSNIAKARINSWYLGA